MQILSLYIESLFSELQGNRSFFAYVFIERKKK